MFGGGTACTGAGGSRELTLARADSLPAGVESAHAQGQAQPRPVAALRVAHCATGIIFFYLFFLLRRLLHLCCGSAQAQATSVGEEVGRGHMLGRMWAGARWDKWLN